MFKLKAAVIGAGSTYTPELIEGFIERFESLPFDNITLMDIDEKRLEIVGGLAVRQLKAGGYKGEVVLTTDREKALDGAMFVFGQVRIGKMPARITDEKIPMKYGLLGQETTGMGGFMMGLRTVPFIMELTEDLKRLCETDAWLINFSNPSGIIAEAVLNNTDINMLGLCNVPVNMLKDVSEKAGEKVTDFEYVGLNHLSWITSVEPYYPSYYLDYFEKHEEKIREFAEAEKTRGEVCLEIEEQLLKQFSDENLCVKPEELSKRGGALYSTAAVSAVDAIYNDKREPHVVAALNKGAVPFMADDDVVEIRCLLGKNSIIPIPVTKYNDYIKGLMIKVKVYEKLAVRAALDGDRELALAAIHAHPLIGNHPKAKQMLEEMLEVNRIYLPRFFK